MTLERVHVCRPEAAERGEPRLELDQRFGPESIDAMLRLDPRLDEARVAQHAEVLGHRGLRHAELALELADRPLGRGQQAQQRSAARLGEDGERGFHGSYIPIWAYACQGTYASSPRGAARAGVPGSGAFEIARGASPPRAHRLETTSASRRCSRTAATTSRIAALTNAALAESVTAEPCVAPGTISWMLSLESFAVSSWSAAHPPQR